MKLLVLKYGNNIIGVYTTVENAAIAIMGKDHDTALFHRICATLEVFGEYGAYTLRVGYLDSPPNDGWKKFDVVED